MQVKNLNFRGLPVHSTDNINKQKFLKFLSNERHTWELNIILILLNVNFKNSKNYVWKLLRNFK